jgi:1,3-beta-glucanosyltransferase GAS5
LRIAGTIKHYILKKIRPQKMCEAWQRRHWSTVIFLASLVLRGIVQAQNCSSIATPALIKGKKFFNRLTGKYIPLIGVNYYPRPNSGNLTLTNSIDFFTEEFRSTWERDIAYFQQLNVNLVSVYAVAPGQDHKGFMCALQAAGIYVIVGLAADCENCAITKDSAPACYPAELKTRGQFIISEFARYDNVIGFSAGNEASLNAVTGLGNFPCQKQFIRDMRAFIASCSNTVRHIPVGVAFADVNREEHALWLGCRSNATDELENAEYVGINAYQHCNGASDSLPGYEAMLSDFVSYALTVPVAITEFGCIDASFPTINGYEAQRNFIDVYALFSSQYREVFVGGAVFEYSTELINSASPFPFTTFGQGNFGIGYFTPEDCDDISTPCVYEPFPQFATLASKYAAVDVSDEPNIKNYSPSITTLPTCPSAIAPLSNFTWPSESIDDWTCPGINYVECPNVPTECANLGIQFLMTPAPAAPTGSPTESPVGGPTKSPVASPTVKPATSVTDKPVTAGGNATPTTRPTRNPATRAPVRAPVATPTTASAAMTTSQKEIATLLFSLIFLLM